VGEGPVSIGRPIDNTQVYIVSPSQQPQPVGVPGELLIGGDGVARGYLSQPELTAERFIADPFSGTPGARAYRTGDLAKWRPDGTIECLGRMDNQVKLRGFRIELGEIESALANHPGVKQNVAALREDAPGQKRLVAYFIPAVEPAPTAGELRGHLMAYLPDYMVPTLFVALEKLPLTPNGKLDRSALPVTEDEAAHSARPMVAPRTPHERTLAEIWKRVLRLDRVSVEDDIFELGGDSILIFQITSRANQAGLDLAPAQVFRHRTIAELASRLDAAGDSEELRGAASSPITRVNRELFRRKA
jgi:hypothetical protein